MSIALEEAKEQNASLDATIQEMKKASAPSINSQRGQAGHLEYALVDILGDEVDALLSVLGKIYIALNHYSPVLKHYPGVTEILKLVQKALKGESI
ncbi:hypothetical protein E2562_023691 [Oryza meyeriana var. granulata]|uniref:Uncharacterized protein n=1 Tax=Oryza meyeriana var. granulata TaxID=110450 RepID=A0A6G1BNM6_9ORYZ|nr:hypothetical protein E2562_023691 [Oryza meyeriana var. granulata]